MKQIAKFALLLCLLGEMAGLQAQTNLIVKLKTGTEQSHVIASLQKLSFDDGNLIVTNINGTNSHYAVSHIRALLFGDVTDTKVENIFSDNQFCVFPNPAENVLFVPTETSEMFTYSIFRLDGRQVMQNSANVGEALDISELPAGIYFIRVNNQTAKFLKK